MKRVKELIELYREKLQNPKTILEWILAFVCMPFYLLGLSILSTFCIILIGCVPIVIRRSIDNPNMIVFPLDYIKSQFSNNHDLQNLIFNSLILLMFYFEIVLIPYFILYFHSEKKLKNGGYGSEIEKEFHSIYKHFDFENKDLPKEEFLEKKLRFQKRAKEQFIEKKNRYFILCSIWIGMTFLVFKKPIFAFFREFEFDSIFGFETTTYYLYMCLSFYVLYLWFKFMYDDEN